MANNNVTFYKDGNSNNKWSFGECMMHVGKLKSPIEIFIKYEDVNNGLSREDVLRWISIGNELLFPASIEDCFHNKSCNFDDRFDKYVGLRVEFDPVLGNNRSDATQVVIGELIGVNSSYNYVKAKCGRSIITIKKDVFGALDPPDKLTWYGSLKNHRLIDTKENLEAYILRTIDIDEPKIDNTINGYKITIDYGNPYFVSYAHKLATLSFYRYLWSVYFDGLVKKTLYLIDLGITPWDALYAVLSESNNKYGSYYSLLSGPGIKSIQEVVSLLPKQESVNSCFTAANRSDVVWSDDDAILLDRVNKFISTKRVYVPKDKVAFKCIVPTRTLTKDKVYKTEFTFDNPNLLLIKGDDYITREYKKSRFKEVEV